MSPGLVARGSPRPRSSLLAIGVAVDLDDHVADLQPAVAGRPVGVDLGDERALVDGDVELVLDVVARGPVDVDVDGVDAEEGLVAGDRRRCPP